MAKQFNIPRHREIKAKLVNQAIKAETDQRIMSVARRFTVLAKRLRKMNADNGFPGVSEIKAPTLDEAKIAFNKMKAVR